MSDHFQTGVFFKGVVYERRKRMVPKNNPTTEVVTYKFYNEDVNAYLYVDDYAPESYYEIGEFIEVPVRIKAYINKLTNKAAYSLTILKDNVSDYSAGEIF